MIHHDETMGDSYRRLGKQYLGHLLFVPIYLGMGPVFSWVVGAAWEGTFGRLMVVVQIIMTAFAVWCFRDTMASYRDCLAKAELYDKRDGVR